MGVEVLNHAPNSRVEQLTVVDRFNIFALDALHDFGKQAGLLHGPFVVAYGMPLGHQATAERQAQAHHGADDNDQNCSGFQ